MAPGKESGETQAQKRRAKAQGHLVRYPFLKVSTSTWLRNLRHRLSVTKSPFTSTAAIGSQWPTSTVAAAGLNDRFRCIAGIEGRGWEECHNGSAIGLQECIEAEEQAAAHQCRPEPCNPYGRINTHRRCKMLVLTRRPGYFRLKYVHTCST